ncbi:MAG: metal-dependent transcriptional regulator [Deinococcus sp.]|nr:metal-dependent transcriptional regulator [Deinococcus sp.]
MPKTVLSEAQEDYLKQILLLSPSASETPEGPGDPVSTQGLAERLGVRPASVTGMLKKLSELRLVEYEPYRGVRLTESGHKVALEVLRHHRLLETYLHQALGYGWEQVHAEAERLEHHISEAFEQKIAEWLGHPERDPHGDLIPTVELALPKNAQAKKLLAVVAGKTATIVRVATQDTGSLNLCTRLKLKPGSVLAVLEHQLEGVRIQVHQDHFLLPSSLAELLWVVEA